MRVMLWNARHGGGRRALRFAERALSYDIDVIVVTEFRNNEAGNQIRSVLSSGGLIHQSKNDAAPKTNSVLVAAISEFQDLTVPGLGSETHRGVLARFPSFDLLGLYFPGKKKKIPIFEAICALELAELNPASCMVGDLNTGRHYIDEKGARFMASEYFDELERLGWIDSWRSRNPETVEYSWFSHVGNGFRIDHAFSTSTFNDAITGISYTHSVREERLSDHSAMVIDSLLSV